MLWWLWPLAAVYGLLGGQPRSGWAWAEATLVAWVLLLPPCALGWVAARREARRMLRRGGLVWAVLLLATPAAAVPITLSPPVTEWPLITVSEPVTTYALVAPAPEPVPLVLPEAWPPPPAPPLAHTPEPGTLALLGAVGVALGWRLRRRRG
jgi:hypothetical protein